jgi:hypothetical protein
VIGAFPTAQPAAGCDRSRGRGHGLERHDRKAIQAAGLSFIRGFAGPRSPHVVDEAIREAIAGEQIFTQPRPADLPGRPAPSTTNTATNEPRAPCAASMN